MGPIKYVPFSVFRIPTNNATCQLAKIKVVGHRESWCNLPPTRLRQFIRVGKIAVICAFFGNGRSTIRYLCRRVVSEDIYVEGLRITRVRAFLMIRTTMAKGLYV